MGAEITCVPACTIMCAVPPLLSIVRELAPVAEMLNPDVVEKSALPNTSVPTDTGTSSTTPTRAEEALFSIAVLPAWVGAVLGLQGPTDQLPLPVAHVAVPPTEAPGNSSAVGVYCKELANDGSGMPLKSTVAKLPLNIFVP